MHQLWFSFICDHVGDNQILVYKSTAGDETSLDYIKGDILENYWYTNQNHQIKCVNKTGYLGSGLVKLVKLQGAFGPKKMNTM